ncbi:GIY-YIG nuclease family protein [Pseudomonas putida]|uniref:GIY-YIG nuclease family protein n=1 Tax=Pseudomonas putida TaxID=303 RepID=UPI0018D8EB59|nr:GIY-YIG nuclease family protein [Pseudomonas putida]MBH3388006.1 GIY-YIG nuclease family protein [Pseudomonas putida]
MSSHVYLLRDKSHARFKIGKANNILYRARNFSWDSIDFSTSVGLKVTTEAEAYALENILHRTFRHARLQVDYVIATGGPADGGTEWFDLSCWTRLMQYLVDNQDLHNQEYVSGELLASEIVKMRQSSEGGLRRAAVKADKERLPVERMNERRKLHAEQLDLLRVGILSMWPKLRAELDYQRREKQIYGVAQRSSLILVSDRLLERGEFLWRMDHLETHYRYAHGAGAVISSLRQMTRSLGTLCCVSLPQLDLLDADSLCPAQRIIHEVLGDMLSWLRSLPIVDDDWLDFLMPLPSDEEDEIDQCAVNHHIQAALKLAKQSDILPI